VRGQDELLARLHRWDVHRLPDRATTGPDGQPCAPQHFGYHPDCYRSRTSYHPDSDRDGAAGERSPARLERRPIRVVPGQGFQPLRAALLVAGGDAQPLLPPHHSDRERREQQRNAGDEQSRGSEHNGQIRHRNGQIRHGIT